MERTVSRRVFVGSVAAGMPLLGGTAGDAVSPATTGRPHIHGVDGTTDAVFEHAARQLAGIVNTVRRNGATAEDARLAVAHVRTLAVYGQHAGLDRRTRDALRDLVRAKGRDAVLDLEIDRPRVLAQLKKYGVDVDERWRIAHPPDRGIRSQAFDDLYRGGISGVLTTVAAKIEHVAAELDRRGGRLTGIRLVQTDDWQAAVCAHLLLNVSVQSAQAAMLCAAMAFMPGMESQCAFAQMALLYFLAIYAAVCP